VIACLAVYAAVGLVLLALGPRVGRRTAFSLSAIAPIVTVAWLVPHLRAVQRGTVATAHLGWVPQLGLNVDLRLDGMGATMALVVTGVGVVVCLYSMAYFPDGFPGSTRLAGLSVLFAGAMVGLVLADNVYFLYTCWELTTITSYFLIGHHHDRPRARAAALQALLTTAAGGFAMLAGFVLLARGAGSTRLSTILRAPLPHDATTAAALVLVLLGAFTKSAQYPFHAWLPGAMEAPTPVSAYLHSATMVKGGVYLVARFAPLGVPFGFWRPTVVAVGLASMIFGGLRALRQRDLKLLLAFGTISQLGLLVVLFGLGTLEAARAAWMLLVAHAAFKASLFMVVGVIDRDTGTRTIGEIPPLGAGWWRLRIGAAAAAASMVGFPLFAGFVGKEAALTALLHGRFGGNLIVAIGVAIGSALTWAYGLRFLLGAFRHPTVEPEPTDEPTIITAPLAAPGWMFVAPALLLAAAGLALGLAASPLDGFAGSVARGLVSGSSSVHLAIWHPPGMPLVLSVLAIVGGVALVVGGRRTQVVLQLGGRVPSGDAAFLAILRVVASTARRVTGVVQNGSLPVYAGVILLTAAALPAGAFVWHGTWSGWPRFGSPAEVAIVALLLVAATGAAATRRRFSAAVLLGAVGYAMAGLFALSGAPDLALTQAVVETLSTVVFVLVLRRLPTRFERQSTSRRRTVRVLIAGGVAATVFAFALIAGGAGSPTAISNEMVARSVPDGHGRNVVNVILVDFRGLDTLGEISVLAVAAIGVVALARAGRRGPRRIDPDDAATPGTRPADAARRIVFVDTSVHVIFHAILMVSLWLLFSGHNSPGGGFVGGLLAGAAFALRYVAGGITAVRGRSRVRPWTVLGTGIGLAALTATVPLAFGRPVLEVVAHTFSLPGLGSQTLSSAQAFDSGVYLTVLGTVLMAFEAFGDEASEVPA
jgi:multicomponent Na+:H+ antiporter subunit A